MDDEEELELRATLNSEYGEEIVEIAITVYGSVERADNAFDLGQFDGVWGSRGEWAANMLNDTGDLQGLSEHMRGYFDYTRFARDCEVGGDIYVAILRSYDVAVFLTD